MAAIHPAQLPEIRATLAAKAEELTWAATVLVAAPDNPAVFALDGAIIDALVLTRARRIKPAVRP